MASCRVPIRQFPDPIVDTPLASEPQQKIAVLAGGCFWCVEAVFKELRGVISVRNGYAGDRATTSNYFFFSSRRRHTRSLRDWSSDVCSSDLRRTEAPSAPG